jgi:hypothetical protein
MTRTELHELIDRIPENLLAAVELAARDAMIAAIPEEEEEVSPEEAAAIDEALEELKNGGRVYTTEELRRELGLEPIRSMV